MNRASESEHKSAEEIEREVDAARDRVTETIEAIEDKLSPGQLIDKLLPLYRESGASATVEHYGKSLGRAAQANPMPFLLIGAGIAWMALSSSGPPSRRIGREGYGEFTDRVDEDAQESHFGEAAMARVHDAADGALDRMHRTVDGAKASMGGMSRKAEQASERLMSGSREMVSQHPLVLGLAGFTIGAAIGAALPSTQTEDELVGEYSDKLKESAEHVAKQQLDKAGNIISAAASAARGAAEDEGLSLQDGKETARNLVDKLEHVGEAAITAAKDEARTIEHPPIKQDV